MTRIHPPVLAKLIYEPNGCLVYSGALDRGYGKAGLKVNGKSITIRVHRHVYETLVGPVPAGTELDHLCRNRACANPHHLEPIPHAENVRRGFRDRGGRRAA